LRLCPDKYKRKLALLVLSFSPHYFSQDIKISYFDFLESECQRNDEADEKTLKQILLPYLKKVNTAIDYGCGPGFLAKHVSRIINQVFAVDISDGVLECAKIINPSDKIVYLNIQDIDKVIANNSIDMVYSISVIQHVTDVIFEEILQNSFNKLKNAGLILFHIPVDTQGWRSEEEWRKAKSLVGQIKWKYAINCFYRTEKQVEAFLKKHGFDSIQFLDLEYHRQFFIANKP
jgi:SAM-dependent methyltransferase